ncbi:AraC family transcriptional regulator ligand-binding domain-containing protein [Streptomyces sp. NPDC051940]|uniref:AraC family transcriptional regulator n=1 Tax=Streptomyces sp. NPDC051940 TaxID=3155675 RepID=UPI00343E5971
MSHHPEQQLPPGERRIIGRGPEDWDRPRGIAPVLVLADFAAEHGIGTTQCLADSGIAPEWLDEPHRLIQAQQELTVVRNVLGLLGDRPGLGLEVGSRFHLTTSGAWGFTLMSCETMLEVTRTSLEFGSLTCVFSAITAEVDGRDQVSRLAGGAIPTDVRRFLVERDCAAITVMHREVLGDEVAGFLRRVVLGFPTTDPRPYEEFFGVPVSFGSDATELVHDPALLDQPLPQAHPHAARQGAELCRRLVADRRDRGGAAQAVRARLARLGGADDGIDRTARELGMTARTLRRKLAAEGAGYRQLVDDARFARARAELVRGVPTEEVARLLGYAEPSSFIRAFRRWSGTTPQRWGSGR